MSGASADDRRETPGGRRLDLIVAVFFLLLGLLVLEQVWSGMPLTRMRQVGPGMLPAGVGGILVAMSLILVWRNLRRPEALPAVAMPSPAEGARVAAAILMLVLTLALIPVLGTLVALALFILAELRLLERRSLRTSVLAALLIPFFVFVGFEWLLGVSLPAGMIGLR